MRLIIIILLSHIVICSQGQQTLHIKVTGRENKSILANILIKGTTRGYTTDTLGMASVSFLTNGTYTLIASAIGYEEKEIKISIPYSLSNVEIELEIDVHEMEDVIVQSTRTGRTIANVPT